MRILVAEDDELLGAGIREGLSGAGFSVDWMRDGAAARAALKVEPFDCLVLDLGLPKLSGLDLLREIRAANDPLPVLILTARDGIEDRIRGLDGGADDYLVKPFDLAELAARLRALARRGQGRASAVISHRGITLDPATKKVTRNGREVPLNRREYLLLAAMLASPGRVFSRDRLEQAVYSWGEEIGSNAIQVHVHHLRRKLGRDLVRTRRGIGYVIEE